MKEAYVSFETAKLLKEKGFDVCTKSFYKKIDQLLHHNTCALAYWGNSTTLPAPTQQMAMKWLREVHNIDVCVCRELDEHNECFDGYIAVVYDNKVYKVTIRDAEKDLLYEEACESAIKYCLTNLI